MVSTPDDDTDPTGMRALLRGLPDPGPMPDDLVARIQASLDDLATSDRDVSVGRAGVAPTDVSRGTADGSPSRRSSWWVRNAPKAAVAAVVVIGGGAFLSGQLGGLGSGGDSATSGAASDSGGSSADQRAEGASGGNDSAPQSGGDAGSSADRPVRAGGVVVTMSGRTYSVAALASEVDRDDSSEPLAPLTAESPGIGPIGTEMGVRSCLSALGLPADAAARVDLALVDRRPAAVVVVDLDGGRTAYAVGRDCTIGNPSVITGPIDLP